MANTQTEFTRTPGNRLHQAGREKKKEFITSLYPGQVMLMKVLLKVDIATGRALEDNLDNYYTRQAMGEGRPDPVWHNNPAIHQPQQPAGALQEQFLFRRICAFNKKRRKNSAPWDEHSLLRLALLAGEEDSYTQIANQLGRSVKSCRTMYIVMKKAGVV
jgi:hypothetical protein